MAGVVWKDFVDKKIKQRKVVMFAKSRSPACIMSLEMLKTYKMDAGTFEVVNIEKRQDVTEMETYFHTICLTDNRDVPRLFIDGSYFGGEDEIRRMHDDGKLRNILSTADAITAS